MTQKKLLATLTLSLSLAGTAFAHDMGNDLMSLTQSPTTVEAGRFQVDTRVYDFTKVGDAKEHDFLNLIAKYGVLSNLDFGVSFNGVEHVAGETGVGNIGLRAKINVVTQDQISFALIPNVEFPTSSNDALGEDGDVNFGVYAPFTFSVQPQLRVTIMPALQWTKQTGDYETVLAVTGKIAYDVVEEVGVFAEFDFVKMLKDGADAVNVIGFGAYYDVNKDAQLFVNANIGVSDAAPDFNIGVGGAFRF